MLRIPKDSVLLEVGVCSGERTTGRWLCPREGLAFWREAWLEPVELAAAAPAPCKHASRSAGERPMPCFGKVPAAGSRQLVDQETSQGPPAAT